MNPYLSHKIRYISFFAMIMVVFLHSYNIDLKQGLTSLNLGKDFNWFLQNFISNGITRIAVPIFFCISGYLFINNANPTISDFKVKVKKRINTLLIPFLFWSIFGILFYLLLQSLPYSHQFFTKKLIRNYTVLEWLDAIFLNPIPYQLWFLRDLIIMVILSPVIYFLVKKLHVFYLIAILFFWASHHDFVFLSSEGLLFFSFGIYLRIYDPIDIKTISKQNIAYLFVAFWLIILFAKTTFEYYGYSKYIDIIFLKVSIIIGLIAFSKLYDICYSQISKSNFLENNLSYSFFIYAFHEPLLTILKKGIFVLFPKTSIYYLIVYFLTAMLAIIISIIVAKLLKKYFSLLYKISTGSR